VLATEYCAKILLRAAITLNDSFTAHAADAQPAAGWIRPGEVLSE
jgi:hypothetical protein